VHCADVIITIRGAAAAMHGLHVRLQNLRMASAAWVTAHAIASIAAWITAHAIASIAAWVTAHAIASIAESNLRPLSPTLLLTRLGWRRAVRGLQPIEAIIGAKDLGQVAPVRARVAPAAAQPGRCAMLVAKHAHIAVAGTAGPCSSVWITKARIVGIVVRIRVDALAVALPARLVGMLHHAAIRGTGNAGAPV
jgi:hypothetical protein